MEVPRKLRALVVDPSNTVRKIIKKSILFKLGIISDDSDGSGESVFNIVRKSLIEVKSGKPVAGYDMLILPHCMKGECDGTKTTRYLRQLGYDGLIIMLFGDMSIDEAVYFREWGIDVAILKPMTIESLLMGLRGNALFLRVLIKVFKSWHRCTFLIRLRKAQAPQFFK